MSVNNIALRVRFLGIDGLMILPLLLIMVFPSLTMLYILLGIAVVLFIIEKRGMNIFMLFRRIRSSIVGKHRFIRPPWRKPL